MRYRSGMLQFYNLFRSKRLRMWTRKSDGRNIIVQKSKHQTLLTYLKIHSQSKQLKTDIHKYLHSGRCERSLVACVRGRARRAVNSGCGRRARRARGTCTARPARRHNTARAARAGDGQGTRPPTDACRRAARPEPVPPA